MIDIKLYGPQVAGGSTSIADELGPAAPRGRDGARDARRGGGADLERAGVRAHDREVGRAITAQLEPQRELRRARRRGRGACPCRAPTRSR